MSKVEIVGPKDSLMDVLTFLRGKGVFHPEPDILGYIPAGDEFRIRNLVLDEKAVGEKLFFENLRDRIMELLALLPDIPSRPSYLRPLPILDVMTELVEKHLRFGRDTDQQKQALREEGEELARYARFWSVLEPMAMRIHPESSLEFFGVTIRDPADIPTLQDLLERKTGGRCRISTDTADDGTIVGLITTSREKGETLRQVLYEKRIPELSVPDELTDLPFWQKGTALKRRQAEVAARLEGVVAGLETFAHRWLPIYRQTLSWLEERLSLYQATASAYETRQCFFIHGWVAAAEVAEIRRGLNETFAGQTVLHELSILEEDLERVPVLLKNPLYFKPFEFLARLLPLPKYTSYDPTPFLGLFFPLLFGMILGDIGYGIVLGLIAALLLKFFPDRRYVVDSAKILGVSAAYTVVFGLLYGELFGNFGEQSFGLHPLWVERSRAIVPMIWFSLSVGAAHVLFGLVLGISYDLKRKKRYDAVMKATQILVVALAGLLLIDVLVPQPWVFSGPLLIIILLLVPVLILTGGLLAPLELLKNIGNIISYVRIMAIGLCSVLLAHVANQLAGMTGDVVAGIAVAGMLHLFNLILGVFAPTVHALRLHYVEFFSKFLELGGRRFEPLGRRPK